MGRYIFRLLNMGDDIFDIRSVLTHLVLLNGSIALILNYTDTSTFHISILGELGVKESWTKIFIVGPLPCLEYLIIRAGKKGEVLVAKKDAEHAWFDLNTQMIENLDVNKYEFACRLIIHKENFLPLERKSI
ncbi:hypothetical protein MtrunA17_Chr5g0447791 [Medicago truncatula]|uniref:F-box protein interaction domain protein n=2 Tax=Medicago truncatula TaxID=3880 RepID=A0A396HXT5_MEDTR|nr:hypothetical protein MtrunA17_Chr5g0447791 [Medicago truncatula]